MSTSDPTPKPSVRMAHHAFRIINELSQHTGDLVRLREQLVRVELWNTRRDRMGHKARLAALFGGAAAVLANILGTAPAVNVQYYLGLGLIVVVGSVLLWHEVHTWSANRQEDKALEAVAAALREEVQDIHSDIRSVDSYRECVMLLASLDMLSEGHASASPAVDHWRTRVQTRIDQLSAKANAEPDAAKKLELERQVTYLRASLARAGSKETE